MGGGGGTAATLRLDTKFADRHGVTRNRRLSNEFRTKIRRHTFLDSVNKVERKECQ